MSEDRATAAVAGTFLERIVAHKEREVAARKKRRPPGRVEREATDQAPALDFAGALAAPGTRLIAEVKGASPSKGILIEPFEPGAIAADYLTAGADAISVLTDEEFFRGRLDYLREVKALSVAAPKPSPVLRKDFLLDRYQVAEARAAGADAILLIVAMLDDATLRELHAAAREWGMAALVEVHNEDETARALAAGATLIGINNRDLHTFRVDLATTERLTPLIPAGVTIVGGERNRHGGRCASPRGGGGRRDPGRRIAGQSPRSRRGDPRLAGATMTTLIKICGISDVENALVAAGAGAHLIGLNFYPPSHRYVEPGRAEAIVRALRAAGHGTLAVGLFVNEDPARINAIAAEVGLDLIQLSGDEQPADLARLTLPLLRSVRVGAGESLVRVRERITAATTMLGPRDPGPLGQPLTPLIDAHVPGAYGGTGERADWDAAATLSRLWPIVLAGGLTPENVGAAIRVIGPLGVDVSSGVETDKVKDPAKIRAFIQAVGAADAARQRTA